MPPMLLIFEDHYYSAECPENLEWLLGDQSFVLPVIPACAQRMLRHWAFSVLNETKHIAAEQQKRLLLLNEHGS